MDGKIEIDHINIYSKSEHELGRMLSNFYRCDVPTRHGTFKSVEGYWYWLKTNDNKLRTMSGYEAKSYGSSLVPTYKYNEKDFKSDIIYAIFMKIKGNEKIERKLVNSTLPFKHYYVYDKKIIDLPEYQWIVDAITFFRNELKNYKNK